MGAGTYIFTSFVSSSELHMDRGDVVCYLIDNQLGCWVPTVCRVLCNGSVLVRAVISVCP